MPRRPRITILATACVALAGVAHAQAPVPLMNPPRAIPVAPGWFSADGEQLPERGHGTAELTPVADAPVNARSASVALAPGHVYRIRIPLDCRPGTSVDARLAHGTQTYRIWPHWHGGNAVHPQEPLTGFAVLPHGPAQTAHVTVTLPLGAAPVTIGPVQIDDCGAIAGIAPRLLHSNGFEHWDTADRPHGVSVAFAKPGQLFADTVQPVAGGFCATNREHRALLFGTHIPVRFGAVLRLRIMARGRGSVTLYGIPYVAARHRGLPAAVATLRLADDEWASCELVVGQTNPKADTFCPVVGMTGNISIDTLTVEQLSEGL